jgi:hypothetical protein
VERLPRSHQSERLVVSDRALAWRRCSLELDDDADHSILSGNDRKTFVQKVNTATFLESGPVFGQIEV